MIENKSGFYEKLEKEIELFGDMFFFLAHFSKIWIPCKIRKSNRTSHQITFSQLLIKTSIVFNHFLTFYQMDPKS